MMKSNYSVCNEISISNIKPKGWLYEFLKTQANGLTGNLEQAGFPFNRFGWDKFEKTLNFDDRPSWWVYEQTAYWLDGMERCGQLLRDKKLIDRASKSFDNVLNNVDNDGYMGPNFLKKTEGYGRWPHVVFFRAMMARYSATKDNTIVEKISDFYLKNNTDFSRGRDVLNIEIMLWAYGINGNIELLELAEKTYAKYNENCIDDVCVSAMGSRKKIYAHGVSYNEFCKLGAILYSHTGKTDYLKPVVNAFEKMDKMHMLVDGCPCSNEFMIDNDYMQSHETCDITDYTWALGYLLMATGDGQYADKIEKCIFNAGIGSVLEDFKALQYFSCPNQVVLNSSSNHNLFFRGEKWMSYRPNPGIECCPGNVNRFFPNFVSRMWMQKNDSVFATLYGANEVEFDNGICVEEITNYPFDDDIKFLFKMPENKILNFHLRIPSWCKNPRIVVNGIPYPIKVENGFAVINREFAFGDIIVLNLPSKINVCDYKKDGLFVEKGPLVYALGMYGKRIIDESEQNSTKDFPAYNIEADKPWNYTISTDEKNIRFENSKMPNGNPWDINNVPFKIKISANKVNAWKLSRHKKIKQIRNLHDKPYKYIEKQGDFTFTPRFPSKTSIKKYGLGVNETVTLVPMAVAKVRITIFPKV